MGDGGVLKVLKGGCGFGSDRVSVYLRVDVRFVG